MQYCEIQIELDSAHTEAVHELLCAENLSFQESDQSTLEPPPPGRTRIFLYIPEDERKKVPELLTAMQKAVENRPQKKGVPEKPAVAPVLDIKLRDRDEDEWRDAWKRFFATRRLGKLAIVPSWEISAHKPEPGEVTLNLDPGRAFGTGGHESTRLCLRLLEQLAQKLGLGASLFNAAADRLDPSDDNQYITAKTEPSSPEILDVGCGSGVLAIAALGLFPKTRAIAIDTDPEAIEVTVENAELNAVNSRLDSSTTPLAKLKGRFALVLANLTGPTLIELAPALASRVEAGGLLILSGILEIEAQKVAERFLAQGLVETARATEDEWSALQYLRPIL